MAREFAAFLNLTSKDTKLTLALKRGMSIPFTYQILENEPSHVSRQKGTSSEDFCIALGTVRTCR